MKHYQVALTLGSVVFALYFIKYKANESGLWVLVEAGGVLLAAYPLTVLFMLFIFLPMASYLFYDVEKEEVANIPSPNIENILTVISYLSVITAFFLSDYI